MVGISLDSTLSHGRRSVSQDCDLFLSQGMNLFASAWWCCLSSNTAKGWHLSGCKVNAILSLFILCRLHKGVIFLSDLKWSKDGRNTRSVFFFHSSLFCLFFTNIIVVFFFIILASRNLYLLSKI